MWIHITKTVSVDIWVWAHITKTVAVDIWVWTHITKTVSVDIWVWTHITKAVAVDIWVWTHITKAVAVDIWVWTHITKAVAVDIVRQYKYLGLCLDEHLKFDTALTELAKSASGALGVLISNCFALGGMDHKMFTSLYETLVQPILNYGASLWGTKHMLEMFKIKNTSFI